MGSRLALCRVVLAKFVRHVLAVGHRVSTRRRLASAIGLGASAAEARDSGRSPREGSEADALLRVVCSREIEVFEPD